MVSFALKELTLFLLKGIKSRKYHCNRFNTWASPHKQTQGEVLGKRGFLFRKIGKGKGFKKGGRKEREVK